MKSRIDTFPDLLKIIKLDSCGSTNTYLKEHYQVLEHTLPVLVCADRQTAGRGRDDRIWASQKGFGLYSSFGFHIDTGKKIGLIPLAAGISVIETLLEIADLEIGLKWPNDIMIKGKWKIAGILIENKIFDKQIYCITGIGVNVNYKKMDFPEALRDRAVSLKCITGRDYRIIDINKILSHHYLAYLDQITKNRGGEIIEKANEWSSQLKGREIAFHQGKNMTRGIFRRIHDDGGVVLENSQGEERIYYSGEIC